MAQAPRGKNETIQAFRARLDKATNTRLAANKTAANARNKSIQASNNKTSKNYVKPTPTKASPNVGTGFSGNLNTPPVIKSNPVAKIRQVNTTRAEQLKSADESPAQTAARHAKAKKQPN